MPQLTTFFCAAFTRPTFSFLSWLGVGLFLLAGFDCLAQTTRTLRYDLPEQVFVFVETPPAFPGGFRALREYMIKHINYPPEARKAGVQGRVFVNFIVEQDGSLTDIQVIKGIGFGCDEEALSLIRAMPRWIAGTQSGQTVRVRHTLPVLFGTEYPANYPGTRAISFVPLPDEYGLTERYKHTAITLLCPRRSQTPPKSRID